VSQPPALAATRAACNRSPLLARLLSATLLLASCAGPPQTSGQALFLHEYDQAGHGRKTWFDRVVETDPGQIGVHVSPAFTAAPPRRIAVLPFVDRGSGNYVLDKVPLTLRSQQRLEIWRWTDANRLRRAIDGFLSAREFTTVPIPEVDATLAAHGIDDDAKLARVPPQTLARWLGVDAVVYGAVQHYEVYYLFLLAGWEVTLQFAMASASNGETLIEGHGSEYKLEVRPAIDVPDIAINSALDTTDLRDIDLRRDEEEVARELILRIPPTGLAPMPDGPPLPEPLPEALTPIALATGYGAVSAPRETFFLPEVDLTRHGRKSILDRLIETDPGSFTASIAPDYCAQAPRRIAVLPFAFDGSGHLIIDGLPVSLLRGADARARWRWTYANHMREALAAFLAQREFSLVPLPRIDAVLAAHGITTLGALDAVPAAQLGAWLGADTLVRGEVTAYQGLYIFLIGGWRVGLRMEMVAAANAETLMRIAGGRYAVAVQVAILPIDLFIDSGLSLLKLRDVRLRRAEEEVSREVLLRIPSCAAVGG